MAREVWVSIELVTIPSGKLEPVTRGVFTKKVKALKADNRPKFTYAMPVRLNQVLPDGYFGRHVEQ